LHDDHLYVYRQLRLEGYTKSHLMRAGLEQGRQRSIGVFRLDTDKIAEVPEDHAVDVVAHFVVQENEGNLRTAHGLTG
jgi:hypothetical protein